ncbi:MAG: Lytic transglycosylase catalytic [Rariglobus sp.]|jgi:membrane-bound lytic murein transglycosylase D|nr:Lytic transglycosylase catalytic [Rariglobus sp.]
MISAGLLPRSFVFLLASGTLIATTPPSGTTEEADLFSLGQALFDAYAPPEIKKEFAFPTREQWDAFAARLEKTRETGSLAELAAYETEVRAALLALRALPDYQDYADWLAGRLDEIVIAKQATTPPAPPPVPPPSVPDTPAPTPPPPVVPRPVPAGADIPMYDLWVSRLRDRPRPPRADEFLPDLKKVFVAEGIPAEFAWMAETESTFNPGARSPAGARGLFQLMPVTAKAQGLSLLPFDERTNPEKSARAAATLLKRLHGMFNSWPLALAAYNAGEGRVRRTLKAQDATTFAQIADALPSETRLYVPKVLATLAVREGLDPATLAAPQK